MNHAKLEELLPQVLMNLEIGATIAIDKTNRNAFRAIAIQLRAAMAEQPEGKVVPVFLPDIIGPVTSICDQIAEHVDFDGCESDQDAISQVLNALKYIAAAPNNAAATQERNLNSSHSEAGGASDGPLPDSPAPAAAPILQVDSSVRELLREAGLNDTAPTPSKLPLNHEEIESVREGFLLGKFQDLCAQAIAAIDLKQRVAELKDQLSSVRKMSNIWFDYGRETMIERNRLEQEVAILKQGTKEIDDLAIYWGKRAEKAEAERDAALQALKYAIDHQGHHLAKHQRAINAAISAEGEKRD